MTRTVVVAPLKPGTRMQVRQLLDSGPPFPLADTELTAHAVYLTDGEAVFVFEGQAPRVDVERIAGDPGVWRSARAWQACLAGRPRIAEEAFAWVRDDS